MGGVSEYMYRIQNFSRPVHLAVTFRYIVTSHGVLGTRQALKWRGILFKLSLS